jgi:multiple sugar transport system permease protein
MNELLIKKILIVSGSLILVVFALAPFVWMLWVSFTSDPTFLISGSTRYSLDNYVQVLTDETLHFVDYCKYSLVISFVTAISVSVASALAGYAVSRLRFPGRMIIPIGVLALSMFPQISIVGYLYRFFSSIGIINTYAALILPYCAFTVPLALWITMSYFSQIPKELDKAARIDGAGRLKTLFRIVLPLSLPGIFSSFLLVFIAAFNEFLFAIMLTIDYHAQPLTVGIALFEGLHGQIPWGTLMAASAIASVPLAILALVFQRYIVQGLTAGSVKG